MSRLTVKSCRPILYRGGFCIDGRTSAADANEPACLRNVRRSTMEPRLQCSENASPGATSVSEAGPHCSTVVTFPANLTIVRDLGYRLHYVQSRSVACLQRGPWGEGSAAGSSGPDYTLAGAGDRTMNRRRFTQQLAAAVGAMSLGRTTRGEGTSDSRQRLASMASASTGSCSNWRSSGRIRTAASAAWPTRSSTGRAASGR